MDLLRQTDKIRMSQHKDAKALVAVSLGSNLGNSRVILGAAVKALAESSEITLEAQSSWYQTPALGPPQPDYLNGCLRLRSTYSPEHLLEMLLNVETQFGRVRNQRWGPRTLDLDLLLYDQWVMNTPRLTLPHPGLHQRAFVLVPLAQILPDWIHPIYHQAIAQLVKTVDCTGIHLLPN